MLKHISEYDADQSKKCNFEIMMEKYNQEEQNDIESYAKLHNIDKVGFALF